MTRPARKPDLDSLSRAVAKYERAQNRYDKHKDDPESDSVIRGEDYEAATDAAFAVARLAVEFVKEAKGGKATKTRAAKNNCEHCIGPAPEGKRFCSKKCQACEQVDGPPCSPECAKLNEENANG